MGFQISPGVAVSEIDLTTIVPAVSTTVAGMGGVFRWGPIGVPLLIDSEVTLAKRYGKPTSYNAETWFTGANFLAYGNALLVSRAANTSDSTNGVTTAVANCTSASPTGSNLQSLVVTNRDSYDNVNFSGQSDVAYVAKWPGALGNSLKVSICDSANAYTSNITTTNVSFAVGSNAATLNFASIANANAAWQAMVVGDWIQVGNASLGVQTLQISSLGTQPAANTVSLSFYQKLSLSANVTGVTNLVRLWENYNAVTSAPGVSTYGSTFGNTAAVDEVHVVVSDAGGLFTGVPGTILEVFQGLSRATDGKNADGTVNYYKSVINQNSNYLWFANDRPGSPSNTSLNMASVNTLPLSVTLNGGQDGYDESNVDISSITTAYDVFKAKDVYDVSLILTGKNRGGTDGEQLANYLIDNIAEYRKDCVVFISPNKADVVSNAGNEAADIAAFRALLHSTTYGFLDSGYGWQYDRYNDIYRYIPLNGGTAGLAVRTDLLRDPWWSFAGYNRGQYLNITKLAYNPGKRADRDLLFQNSVNPVVTERNLGTNLLGDKTLSAKPGAFDAINVRRLFIVLEKAISTMAKFNLFEFNDTVTRSQFLSQVNPYLRDIKGRRGITDFRVVCDETNNTGEVIDSERFVGDIYVKPARATRYIQLNFVSVGTDVVFTEITGSF